MFQLTHDDYVKARIGTLFKVEAAALENADMPRISGLYEAVCNDVRAAWPGFQGDLPKIFVAETDMLVQALLEFPNFEMRCKGVVMGRHMLDKLGDTEVKALLAHEMGHYLHNHIGVRESGFLYSPAIAGRKVGLPRQKARDMAEREADSVAVRLYGVEALRDALFAVATLHCAPRALSGVFAKTVRRAAAINPALGELVLVNAGNGKAKDFNVPIARRLRWQKLDLKRSA